MLTHVDKHYLYTHGNQYLINGFPSITLSLPVAFALITALEKIQLFTCRLCIHTHLRLLFKSQVYLNIYGNVIVDLDHYKKHK